MFLQKKLLKKSSEKIEELFESIRGKKNTAAFSMQWADRTVVAANLEQFVYVCNDYVAAKETFRQLSTLRTDCVYLPAKDDVLTYIRSRNDETAFERLAALFAIVSGRTGAVVTTAEAVMQLFPERKTFLNNCLTLKKNEEYSLEILLEYLIRSGYKREAVVAAKGQFSKRGDILDISPINLDTGIRLEFFGDELESLKTIDFASQKSLEHIEFVDIAPASEFFAGTNGRDIIAKMRTDFSENLDAESKIRINNILSELEFKIEQGITDTSLSYALPYVTNSSFWEFLNGTPRNGSIAENYKSVVDKPVNAQGDGGFVIVLDEVKKLNAKIVYGEHCNRFRQLLAKGEVLRCSVNQLDENALSYIPLPVLGFYNNPLSNDLFLPKNSYSFESMSLPVYTKDFESLIADIRLWSDRGMKIYLFAGGKEVRERLAERLREFSVFFVYGDSQTQEDDAIRVDTKIDPDSYSEYNGSRNNIVLLCEELYKGAVLFEYNTVLIGTYDLIAKKSKKTIKRSRKDIFSQPQIGEFVVHEVHGIGVCESVQRLASGGAERDYLVIGYRDGDKLFVPVENMDSLTKYNSGEESPRLSKIGGAEFARAKERARNSVKQLAFDLLKLYAERSMERGYEYQSFVKEMEEFSADFPYVETDDQIQAIEEGLGDLCSGKIMDRLLCGDVGYGKTEVAIRLAYNAILNGKQVAFVSPTTVLARQHYHTVKQRMEKFGVKVAALNRLVSAADTKKAIEEAKLGKTDIVVGTHRVLSKDVRFKDLGLLILDEEQRFGVGDKEKIKLLKKNVGVLSLSATPIPRTLHMSMSGIRDISILDTPPIERIPVQTYVTEYTDTLLSDAVSREINRGGQVFIVYNRVASIDTFAAKVRGIVDEEVCIIHGQMPEKQMEDTLDAFVSGHYKILIASTIIENGIDMPNANTMIVIDSDRLGLSQLYQLRGRVGRSNRLAYVFFTYDESKMLTETAYKRLESINEFTEFGSGFKIAMRDLQIRGAGNIMGREQHGHMEKIGYDMYLKILSEELEKLKGATLKRRSEVKVNIDFDAFIPESYIPDTEWRLKVYSRISHIETQNEILRLASELKDIYGDVPNSVLGLCRIALVKNIASLACVDSVTYKKSDYALNYKKLMDIPPAIVDKINSSKACTLKINPAPAVSFGKGEAAEKAMLEFLMADK